MKPAKGQKARTPGSGRKPGTKNRNTQELADRAAALGCDPFEILCLFAKGDWKALGYAEEKRIVSESEKSVTYREYVTPELRQGSAADLAQYLFPKRKAIDHKFDDADGFRVVVLDYGGKADGRSDNRAPAKAKGMAPGN